MESIEILLAIEAIKLLKARYFRFVDTKDWSSFRKLFADDATLFFPENEAVPGTIDDFMRLVPDALAGGVTVHQGYMPEIEILNPVAARSIWAMDDYLFFPPGVTGIAGAAEIRGTGHYHETYTRLNGAWLFQTLVLTRLRLEVIPGPRSVALPPPAQNV